MAKRREKADIETIRALVIDDKMNSNRLLIATVMRACGATYQEIGDVFNFSRQRAEAMLKADR